MGFMGHGVEGEHYPWYFLDPPLWGGAFLQEGPEKVVDGTMASLVDGIALGVVGGGKDLLNPESR